jgi:hypothetical protein
MIKNQYSMNYIDLNDFLNCINRQNIIELSIEKILYKNQHYIFVQAVHYHNEKNKDRYLIKTENQFITHHSSKIIISSLYGLNHLERLKITNIDKLEELPCFSDCVKLKTLICSNNNLLTLPRKLHPSITYFNCSYNKLTELPVLHEGIHIYCNHNQIESLPLLPNKYLFYFDSNPVKQLYTSNNYKNIKKTNRILYKFKYNYYFIKYAKKIFYFLLRKKMNRIKSELLSKSAIITMNPRRIERILNLYEICGYDFDDI